MKIKHSQTGYKCQSTVYVGPRSGLGRWPAVRLWVSTHGPALGVGPRSGIGRWPAVRLWALARGQALGVGAWGYLADVR